MQAFLQAIIDGISFFFRPVTRVFVSLFGAVSLLLGAIANPEGAVNQFLCKMIDLVAFVIPSTPPNLTIGSLLRQVGDSVPIIGYGIVLDVFQTAAAMLGLVLIIKIYKLIPFKAT